MQVRRAIRLGYGLVVSLVAYFRGTNIEGIDDSRRLARTVRSGKERFAAQGWHYAQFHFVLCHRHDASRL